MQTRNVTTTIYGQSGNHGAKVSAKLDRLDVNAGYIVPELTETVADASGVAVCGPTPWAAPKASTASGLSTEAARRGGGCSRFRLQLARTTGD